MSITEFSIPLKYEGLPTNLIMDGKLLKDALQSLNLTTAWLTYHLSNSDIEDLSSISLAQLDTQGNLYIDFKGEKPSVIIKTTQ